MEYLKYHQELERLINLSGEEEMSTRDQAFYIKGALFVLESIGADPQKVEEFKQQLIFRLTEKMIEKDEGPLDLG